MSSWEEYETYLGAQGWEDPSFDIIRQRMHEETEFVEKPIHIEEGVMQCHHCKGYKTYSHQRQVRSADEGFTTFVSCFECGAHRREN